MKELEAEGVFSRDRNGTIYSKRMVRDDKKAATAQKNGAEEEIQAFQITVEIRRWITIGHLERNGPSFLPRDQEPQTP